MSGIAEVLLTLGYKVTGSDLRTTRVTEALESAGAEVFSGHAIENLGNAHVVVRSSAVPQDNVEILRAEVLKVPVISRAEMLAELARLKYTIAVAGTHGKTTTTSMIATILDGAKMDPTFVVGGRLNTVGRNARLGKGEFIVVEADESDGSFLMLSPTIAVITNIEADHLDYFRDLDDIQDNFVSFVNKVPFYGAVIACSDEPAVKGILPRTKRRVITFGLNEEADVAVADCQLDSMGSSFVLRFNGLEEQSCVLKVPGMHNVLNAAGAFTAALEMGVAPDVIALALENFAGVERRYEIKCRTGVVLIDDYAHHPTEVKATLSAARSAGFQKILAVFQPHRFSRTQYLFDDFVSAFDDADTVLITDIYAAGEVSIEGVTSRRLVESMKDLGKKRVEYFPDFDDIHSYLLANAKPGDAVVVMGAGSITKLADSLAGEFEQRGLPKVHHE